MLHTHIENGCTPEQKHAVGAEYWQQVCTHDKMPHWNANRFAGVPASAKVSPLVNMHVAASGTVNTRNLRKIKRIRATWNNELGNGSDRCAVL